MGKQSFGAHFTVDQSQDEVFKAISNVRGWWSEEIEGRTDTLGSEFTYRYQDAHRCKVKITEFVTGQKILWLILDNHFNFTRDKSEWKGTTVVFEISKVGHKTKLRFTHKGLVPEYECFDVCSNAWSSYINGSLRGLIESGKGHPNQKEKVKG